MASVGVDRPSRSRDETLHATGFHRSPDRHMHTAPQGGGLNLLLVLYVYSCTIKPRVHGSVQASPPVEMVARTQTPASSTRTIY